MISYKIDRKLGKNILFFGIKQKYNFKLTGRLLIGLNESLDGLYLMKFSCNSKRDEMT